MKKTICKKEELTRRNFYSFSLYLNPLTTRCYNYDDDDDLADPFDDNLTIGVEY